jgi:hypothetical protein
MGAESKLGRVWHDVIRPWLAGKDRGEFRALPAKAWCNTIVNKVERKAGLGPAREKGG